MSVPNAAAVASCQRPGGATGALAGGVAGSAVGAAAVDAADATWSSTMTSTRRGPCGGLGKPCSAASYIAASASEWSSQGPSLLAWLSKTTLLDARSRTSTSTSRTYQGR